MATTIDNGLARLSLAELLNLRRRQPNCRYRRDLDKEIKARQGREKQLQRNGGKSKTKRHR